MAERPDGLGRGGDDAGMTRDEWLTVDHRGVLLEFCE
jgi:hypothetical protein